VGEGAGGRGGCRHWPSLAALCQTVPAVDCIVSNEFFDALPVHRLARLNGRFWELYVDAAGDGFGERWGELSTSRLAEWLEARPEALADGWRGEACLRLEPILADVAQLVERGAVLTIDYGYGATDAAGELPGDTVVGYRRHQWTDDLYRLAGELDLTSHVDFRALFRVGRTVGLVPAGATTQRGFLLGLGLARDAERWVGREATPGRRWQARCALTELVQPRGLGRLTVVLQTKGVASFLLTGAS
jgi:SAM-dependent MidA family methyltransferase